MQREYACFLFESHSTLRFIKAKRSKWASLLIVWSQTRSSMMRFHDSPFVWLFLFPIFTVIKSRFDDDHDDQTDRRSSNSKNFRLPFVYQVLRIAEIFFHFWNLQSVRSKVVFLFLAKCSEMSFSSATIETNMK